MIATGSKLGAYEVGSLIGEGGMGEVYRARDTWLNRDVAISWLLGYRKRYGSSLARSNTL
jgi:serine/threonine protein kinase